MSGEVYAVYLPGGGSTLLVLNRVAGSFEVKRYNPGQGGALAIGTVQTVQG